MPKKESLPSALPTEWLASDDEIDLFALLQTLWAKRYRLMAITALTTLLGVGYALYAEEEWRAEAVVNAPRQLELQPLLNLGQKMTLLAQSSATTNPIPNQGATANADTLPRIYQDLLNALPESTTLYQLFLTEFNGFDNKRDFLLQSAPYQRFLAKNPDALAKQSWLRTQAEGINATPVDKNQPFGSVTLEFAANDPEEAKLLLEGYLAQLQVRLQQQIIKQVTQARSDALDTLTVQIEQVRNKARMQLNTEIARTRLGHEVARAAGSEKPLENSVRDELFPIDLGARALERKLVLLQEIDLALFEPQLSALRQDIENLKALKVGSLKVQPFNYLEQPERPLNRQKPKRALVVILAMLLGAMLGVMTVLIGEAVKSRRETNPA